MIKHYLGIVKGQTCQGTRSGVLDWCKMIGAEVEEKPEVSGEFMVIVVAPKDCEIGSFSAETYDELMEKVKCI